MAIELKMEDFKIVESFFNENKFQIPALAVINTKFPGKVFVDNKEKPEIALVWALSRWSYISCKEILPQYRGFIVEVFNNMITPLLKDIGENYFEIYSDNNSLWDDVLNEALKDYLVSRHYENTFILDKEKFKNSDLSFYLMKDIEVCENTLPIVPEAYNNYYAYDKFDNEVFGMALRKNGERITQCVNNGFTYENQYFIDLDTFNNCERNKGYGTFTAYNLIISQMRKGFLPIWETTVDNISSQKVAKKLGFEKIEEYPVYSIKKF